MLLHKRKVAYIHFYVTIIIIGIVIGIIFLFI